MTQWFEMRGGPPRPSHRRNTRMWPLIATAAIALLTALALPILAVPDSRRPAGKPKAAARSTARTTAPHPRARESGSGKPAAPALTAVDKQPSTDPVEAAAIAKVVERLYEQAIDAMLEGDHGAARRLALTALEMMDGAPGSVTSQQVRRRLTKIVEQTRESGSPEAEDPAAPPPAARTTCALSGTAWVTRGNGEIVRLAGMRVELLRPFLDAKTAGRAFTELSAILADLKRKLTRLYRDRREERESVLQRIQVARELLYDKRTSVDALFRVINTCRMLGDERLAATEAWGTMVVRTEAARRAHASLFARLLEVQKSTFAPARVAAGTTDVDGQYTIPQIPPGTYLVFAAQANDVWFIEWLAELPAPGPADYTRDLSNNNARYFENY